MTHLRVAVAGIVLVTVSAALAWGLAYPQNSLSDSIIRAIADIAAIVTLGLAVVPAFDEQRYRSDVADAAAGALITSSAVWAAAELVRMFGTAVRASGVAAQRLDVGTAVDFAVATPPGRVGLLGLATAIGCLLVAILRRTRSAWVTIGGLAALGLAVRGAVGHVAGSTIGGLAVALHTLAAALWCGVLAALVLVVERRGQWSRVLPRFSQVSFGCVLVLIVCGVAAGAVTLPSFPALYETGYGRLLLAKVVVTLLLVALAWRNRAQWLPAARAHRASADVSLVRSRVELAAMGVALTLAAALAVTG